MPLLLGYAGKTGASTGMCALLSALRGQPVAFYGLDAVEARAGWLALFARGASHSAFGGPVALLRSRTHHLLLMRELRWLLRHQAGK